MLCTHIEDASNKKVNNIKKDTDVWRERAAGFIELNRNSGDNNYSTSIHHNLFHICVWMEKKDRLFPHLVYNDYQYCTHLYDCGTEMFLATCCMLQRSVASIVLQWL